MRKILFLTILTTILLFTNHQIPKAQAQTCSPPCGAGYTCTYGPIGEGVCTLTGDPGGPAPTNTPTPTITPTPTPAGSCAPITAGCPGPDSTVPGSGGCCSTLVCRSYKCSIPLSSLPPGALETDKCYILNNTGGCDYVCPDLTGQLTAAQCMDMTSAPKTLPNSPCESDKKTCNTAFGRKIDTSRPVAFIKDFFNIILGITGAIAIILIIIAGYTFMTSRGDKQKIAGARETLISAITGLLFIVFSLAILSFIGVSILKIPGFG